MKVETKVKESFKFSLFQRSLFQILTLSKIRVQDSVSSDVNNSPFSAVTLSIREVLHWDNMKLKSWTDVGGKGLTTNLLPPITAVCNVITFPGVLLAPPFWNSCEAYNRNCVCVHKENVACTLEDRIVPLLIDPAIFI